VTVKFKHDADSDRIELSRPLPIGLAYPHDWGFIPSTRASDGDPIDALIAWDGASYPGVVVPCRPIGVLEIEQTNPKSENFFLAAAAFEGKDPKVLGWSGPDDADALVRRSIVPSAVTEGDGSHADRADTHPVTSRAIESR
jgi:inorganic pyrophosphatase